MSERIDGGGGQTPIYHAINTVSDGNFYSLEHLARRVGARVTQLLGF